jgi:hypothetical protein
MSSEKTAEQFAADILESWNDADEGYGDLEKRIAAALEQAIAQARVEEHMAFHGCDHTKTGKWLGFNCEWLAKMRAAAEGEKRG